MINIGILTTIYFIVILAAVLIGFIPIFTPLISVIVPLAGGILMVLSFFKIKKFDIPAICGLLLGVTMLLIGMSYWCISTGLILGLVFDFMMKGCGCKDARCEVSIRGVFSMQTVGAFIPTIVTWDAYYQNLLLGYGQEYADMPMAYILGWILPVLLVAVFVSGLMGGLVGRKLFKGRLERAGIVS